MRGCSRADRIDGWRGEAAAAMTRCEGRWLRRRKGMCVWGSRRQRLARGRRRRRRMLQRYCASPSSGLFRAGETREWVEGGLNGFDVGGADSEPVDQGAARVHSAARCPVCYLAPTLLLVPRSYHLPRFSALSCSSVCHSLSVICRGSRSRFDSDVPGPEEWLRNFSSARSTDYMLRESNGREILGQGPGGQHDPGLGKWRYAKSYRLEVSVSQPPQSVLAITGAQAHGPPNARSGFVVQLWTHTATDSCPARSCIMMERSRLCMTALLCNTLTLIDALCSRNAAESGSDPRASSTRSAHGGAGERALARARLPAGGGPTRLRTRWHHYHVCPRPPPVVRSVSSGNHRVREELHY
eukprot:2172979-Rhodomonas_salina.1